MQAYQTQSYLHQKWKALVGAIEWRLRVRVGDDAFDGAIYRAGKRFRPYLKGTDFFGVAGSVGKTTAKDFLVGILSMRGKCIGNPLSRNAAPELARTILRTRPWHRYCVTEIGESAPGTLDKHLAALAPVVGLVTNIGDDHLSAFGSREAIAREIAKLAHVLPAHGALILNDDDEAVAALRDEACCRVINYGTTARADLQAHDVTSDWPEPLRFDVTFNGKRVTVRTQLHGRQLLTSALAAIGGGLAAGLPLEECARGIARVAPVEGRMQPVHGPGNITFIRDDFKAPAWTIRPLLEQLRHVRNVRKILVLGTVSDCGHTPRFIAAIAREALEVADIVIFAGRFASAALKARTPETEARLLAFSRIRDVATAIDSLKRDGDLIVLKGHNTTDHLARIPLALQQTVNCWVDDCKREIFCHECSHIRSHRGPPGLAAHAAAQIVADGKTAGPLPVVGDKDQIVIGLGNPGAEFVGTPHNVGYQALEALSAASDAEWRDYRQAEIASEPLGDARLWLLKVKTPMNLIGPILKQLSEAMHFDSSRCILVFDDIDLPLGKVRTRMNGSSGGHRGVASILEAFQSDQIRRIKIGVRTLTVDTAKADLVLTPFSADQMPAVRAAIGDAIQKIHSLAVPLPE